jgi:hypothetical protein
MPSLHILLATIARPSLHKMLDSIFPFLTKEDHITIVFDGVDVIPINQETLGTIHIFQEPIALGFWGHGVRNKYAPLLQKTDFVMHADDDDTYNKHAFITIRSICTDVNTLYIMKLFNEKRNTYVPAYPKIENTNISTQCGIIPFERNMKGYWGLYYGGDFAFYQSIEALGPVTFCENVIYLYNCPWN